MTDQQKARAWAVWMLAEAERERDAIIPPSSIGAFAALLDRLAEGETDYRVMIEGGKVFDSRTTLECARGEIALEIEAKMPHAHKMYIESRRVGPWRKVEEDAA